MPEISSSRLNLVNAKNDVPKESPKAIDEKP
jgi:hypothetical protein